MVLWQSCRSNHFYIIVPLGHCYMCPAPPYFCNIICCKISLRRWVPQRGGKTSKYCIYTALLFEKCGGWSSNEKTHLCKQEKRLCVIFSWSIKLQLQKDNIVVVEDSDIRNPECISFSPVSVSHVCLFPFHFVYCVPNSSLVFFEWIKESLDSCLPQDCSEDYGILGIHSW